MFYFWLCVDLNKFGIYYYKSVLLETWLGLVLFNHSLILSWFGPSSVFLFFFFWFLLIIRLFFYFTRTAIFYCISICTFIEYFFHHKLDKTSLVQNTTKPDLNYNKRSLIEICCGSFPLNAVLGESCVCKTCCWHVAVGKVCGPGFSVSVLSE